MTRDSQIKSNKPDTRRSKRIEMATKKIINSEIGKGWHYFEGSAVNQLIHSGY
jgi:hypothetical protein